MLLNKVSYAYQGSIYLI